MDRVSNLVSSAADHSVKTVAAAVIICTLIEPVCKVVKKVWETQMLGLDGYKTQSGYEAASKREYDGLTKKPFKKLNNWVEKLSFVGMTFNKYRPFADASAPTLAIAFMFAALVLKSHK